MQIGAALQQVIQEGKVKREDLCIVSKLPQSCHGKDQVRPRLEVSSQTFLFQRSPPSKQTLRDLQVSCLDLYLIHWPASWSPESWQGSVENPGKGSESLVNVCIASFSYALQACIRRLE
jgi:diketogulonate reductase-like aldo/keto reductase